MGVERIEVVDLNRADSLELLKVSGIGPYYAGKIVEYRERLGGFVSINQLTELWKMTPEKVEGFANQLRLDPLDVSPLLINSVSIEIIGFAKY